MLNSRFRILMAVISMLAVLGGPSAAGATSKPADEVGAKRALTAPGKPVQKRVEKRAQKRVENRADKGVENSPDKPADRAEALTDEQLALVPRVATGVLPCELSHAVSVQAHPQHAGHFVVESGKQRFAMVPVATSSGAVRLEDAARGAVWLQLANKSMLMDHKRGRRLADACMSPEQHAVARAMEKDPDSHLLAPAPANAPQAEIATK